MRRQGAPMIYRSNDFSIDTDRRELCRGGMLQPVEPQVFDLLEYLIRNRDRVIGRDELYKAIWRDRIVSDSLLTSRISVARSAIGDNGKDQRLIRTLRTKGLRFVGVVREEQKTAARRSRAKIQPTQFAWMLDERPSVAILPFVDLDRDSKHSYFASGL